jgi:hypothetical protein
VSHFSKYFSWAGLLVGGALLLLQFGLTINMRLANGDSVLGAIWYLSAFFTILNNIGVFLVHLSARTSFTWLDWFRLPHVRTMFATLIFIVMMVYHFVLAPLWQPQGLAFITDTGLHYVTPLVYLGWWFGYQRRAKTRFGHLSYMLVPPIIYLTWVMVRGQFVNEYPYFFINLDSLGPNQTMINIAGLFLLIFVMYAVFVLIESRFLLRTVSKSSSL